MKKLIVATAIAAGLVLAGAFLLPDLFLNKASAQLPDLRGLDKGLDRVIKDPKAKQAIDAGRDLVEAQKPWTYPEERATGRVLAAKVAKNFGGLWMNKEWTDYVNIVGRSLSIYGNRPDIKYRFAILNSDQVNAYSCPGGYIFITRGMLKVINSEAQLAGVLAHEIAHVSERHIEKEVKNQQVAGALLRHGLSFAARDGEITAEQAEALKGIGDLGYEVLVKNGYSRQDEFEADRVATETIYKMGYSPTALAGLLKRLDEGGGKKSDLEVLVSTHPKAGDRIKAINKFVSDKGWSVRGKRNGASCYQELMQKHPIP